MAVPEGRLQIGGSEDQPLQQGPLADGYPLIVEDLGTHSNPEAYRVANSFRSQVATSPDDAAHALWTVGTVPARTAGRLTFIYEILVTNHGCEAGAMVLEIAGVPICIPIPVSKRGSVPIVLIVPIRVGNNDVNYHASRAGMKVEILGLEVAP